MASGSAGWVTTVPLPVPVGHWHCQWRKYVALVVWRLQRLCSIVYKLSTTLWHYIVVTPRRARPGVTRGHAATADGAKNCPSGFLLENAERSNQSLITLSVCLSVRHG